MGYCEGCYHEKFGVRCTYCHRFISGKVLQAGDNNHFHPTCARCTKCGDPFGDGEEMYLQVRPEPVVLSWNNGKEVPRWGVAEIQKMSPQQLGDVIVVTNCPP